MAVVAEAMVLMVLADAIAYARLDCEAAAIIDETLGLAEIEAASNDTFPGTVLRPTDVNSSILIIFKFQRYVFEIYFVSFSKKSLKRSRYYGR